MACDLAGLEIVVRSERPPPTYKRLDIKKKPGGSRVEDISNVLAAAAQVYRADIADVVRLTVRRGRAKDARHAAMYLALVDMRISPRDICAYFHYETETALRDLHWDIFRRVCEDEDLIAELDEIRARCKTHTPDSEEA